MNLSLKKIEKQLLDRDTWLFIGAICLATIISMLEKPENSWKFYLIHLAVLLILLTPQIIWDWHKTVLLNRWIKTKYLLGWGFIYLLYPFLVFILLYNLPEINFKGIKLNLPAFGVATISTFIISFYLLVQPYINQHFKRFIWKKMMSLEAAIMLALFLVALFMAGIVVSNQEQFNQRATIDMLWNLKEIAQNLWLFLTIAAQLYIAYLAGFLFFIINEKFLISQLLRKKGILYYIFGLISTIVILYPFLAQLLIWLPLHQELRIVVPSENLDAFDITNAGVVITIILVSIPVIFALQWFKQNSQMEKMEKQQVQTELDLLKQQINPHFFFNTLNNLYALSLSGSSKTPEGILQLSDLMRYVIYKGKEPKVLLKEEISYIKDYIRLQQLRLQQEFEVEFSISVEDTLKIAPLLLIILVENAFKHGIEPAENKTFLSLSVKTVDNKLTFSCKNSHEEDNINSSGIGLANLQRRLTLLYPQQHELKAEKKNGVYYAYLTITLK
ncbi:histidine kinase [Marivirga sp. S37H4]|uniref:Histidine kinase n=1 Tax=Marivirga aurantiaca TaxID=2802615 RepID=A0A934WZB2_9BACT|nr:histidine kinase [Marivirga aurantiaca]MBK6265964.1 histidine kinase [Marivirga aurantiaca]